MFLIYATVVAVMAAMNLAIAVADLARADFVLTNMDEVKVPRTWLAGLALLKITGTVGLLLGFFGIYIIAIPAAAGLVVFFTGAIVTHIKARVLHNVAFPGSYLALAIASLVLTFRQSATG
jgi:hypothetical protein